MRNLGKFDVEGEIPESSIFDHGFMVQVAAYPIKKKLEVYAATSQIFGEFNNANEFLIGANVYPFNTRNMRVNGQIIFVNNSPVSSVFGYYTGGQSGTTLSVSASILF